MVSQYFVTVHTWVPIISRNRMYGSLLLKPFPQLDPDIVLLLLCMKLVTYSPLSPSADNGSCAMPHDNDGDPSMEDDLYTLTKRFQLMVEDSGCLSIHVVQAGILRAVYEMGHAIYPAAFLTIAACARYGVALRIDQEQKLQDGEGDWLEREEANRVWWGILIIDRRGSRLCTSDPTMNSILPIDDDDWDRGETEEEK
ncbi:hypothetical protein N7474_008151 [Penicillium riverlandense]|uniref:uncharacterized protein n=1 Tax=Penicillium riverlandense TaxID=1903569 RepID=UPI0025468119|nr:uncharacterized protein N7474_008151 [Penicillium riverlandense]KAJ5811850.1 hypothetical protein N7474_008151 [Penicillium riverlandense]